MKIHFLKTITVLLLAFTFSFSGNAQIVVKVRPPAPIIKIRPIRPGPNHIWIGGNYTWRNGHYYYTDGYWAVPSRQHKHWVEGKWKHKRGGWVWIPGRWR